MNEVIKTAILVGVTVVVSLLAIVTLPGDAKVSDEDIVGQSLFPDFVDIADAKSLEVVQYNEELSELRSFRVTQESDGRWVIPSHDNYEADAEDRITDAATLLIDLKVIDKVSDELGDHAVYGVIEPDDEKVRAGDTGIGKLIAMKDGDGNKLAQVIVGKEVADREGQRYLRKPGNNVVYIAKIDPDKVSTTFADWIEQSVLQISSFDIETMRIRDYSVEAGMTPTGQLAVNFDQRLDMTVEWNSDDSAWNLLSLREFRGGELRDTPLLANEELSKDALDGMKNALGDLKIVDVQPKPEGLGAGLKADEGFLNDREGVESLLQNGYYPVTLPEGNSQLLSSDGEVMVATQDGVRCTLRFGRIASVQREGDDQGDVNRFVMITADVDEDRFQRPSPPDLSETTEGAVVEDAVAEDAVAEDSDETADGQDADTEEGDDVDVVDADGDTGADDSDDDADADDGAGVDETSDTEEPTGDSLEKQEEIAAEQDAKLKEYQRELDDYNEKISKAKEKVRDLNYRFADWYYVVSEDVYKKIHLNRADVVVEKESAEAEGTDIEAFRALETDGLQKEEPADTDASAAP